MPSTPVYIRLEEVLNVDGSKGMNLLGLSRLVEQGCSVLFNQYGDQYPDRIEWPDGEVTPMTRTKDGMFDVEILLLQHYCCNQVKQLRRTKF